MVISRKEELKRREKSSKVAKTTFILIGKRAQEIPKEVEYLYVEGADRESK